MNAFHALSIAVGLAATAGLALGDEVLSVTRRAQVLCYGQTSTRTIRIDHSGVISLRDDPDGQRRAGQASPELTAQLAAALQPVAARALPKSVPGEVDDTYELDLELRSGTRSFKATRGQERELAALLLPLHQALDAAVREVGEQEGELTGHVQESAVPVLQGERYVLTRTARLTGPDGQVYAVEGAAREALAGLDGLTVRMRARWVSLPTPLRNQLLEAEVVSPRRVTGLRVRVERQGSDLAVVLDGARFKTVGRLAYVLGSAEGREAVIDGWGVEANMTIRPTMIEATALRPTRLYAGWKPIVGQAGELSQGARVRIEAGEPATGAVWIHQGELRGRVALSTLQVGETPVVGATARVER